MRLAFWLAAAGAWAIGLLRRNDTAWRFGLWLHSLGLLGAGVAGNAQPETGHSHGDGEDAHGSPHHPEEHSEPRSTSPPLAG